MRKGLLIIGFAIVAVAVYFLYFYSGDEKKDYSPKQQPLTISKKSDSFNVPFNNMLNSYFELKDALVNWDTAKANLAAVNLNETIAKVPYEILQADSSIISTAKNLAEGMIAESKAIAGDPDINEKRKSFYTLSEDLYNLARTVQYDQQVIYHDKCPMAFGDDKEAYWISNTRDIINPYLGNKHPKYHSAMMNCGNVEDSLDFRSR